MLSHLIVGMTCRPVHCFPHCMQCYDSFRVYYAHLPLSAKYILLDMLVTVICERLWHDIIHMFDK